MWKIRQAIEGPVRFVSLFLKCDNRQGEKQGEITQAITVRLVAQIHAFNIVGVSPTFHSILQRRADEPSSLIDSLLY